jgi:EAL domain-containing protein (putative c-di-GMP-specific phosphodiesterase class I)
MSSNDIVGHEALLRWSHPEEGEMDGASLLKEIAQPNIIPQINRWIFHHACHEYAQWIQADSCRHRMSLTISLPAFHLVNKGLLDILTESILHSELSPANLNLRITECDQDIHLPEFSQVVNKISNMGIKLSLSLVSSASAPISSLLALDLDSIKIERSFTADVLDDPRSAIFVKGLISMAHNLGMQVTADGVDSAKLERFLRSINCDHVQGNLYQPPAPLAYP